MLNVQFAGSSRLSGSRPTTPTSAKTGPSWRPQRSGSTQHTSGILSDTFAILKNSILWMHDKTFIRYHWTYITYSLRYICYLKIFFSMYDNTLIGYHITYNRYHWRNITYPLIYIFYLKTINSFNVWQDIHPVSLNITTGNVEFTSCCHPSGI